MEYPRLRTFVFPGIAGSLCAGLAVAPALPMPLQLVAGLLALWFWVTAGVAFVDWVAFERSARITENRQAGISDLAMLAESVRDLTDRQTDLVARRAIVEIIGIVGDQAGPIWMARLITGEVPWAFCIDFLNACDTDEWPILWPIGRAYEIQAPHSWPNAERYAERLVNDMIHRRLATPGKGPKGARATVTWEIAAAWYGVIAGDDTRGVRPDIS